MTDREPNKPEVDQAPVSEGVSSDIESLRTDRRHFIKKTIVTVPVILTVTSRPVWARNCTWSGQLSGNLSDAGPPCGGQGCDFEFWKSNTDKWHYEFCTSKVFDQVFGIEAFPGATLLEVINDNVTTIRRYSCKSGRRLRDFGIQAVAAIQNSATRVSFDWGVCAVIDYFADCYVNCDCDGILAATQELSILNSQGCPPL